MTSAGFARFSDGNCSIDGSSQVRIECGTAALGGRHRLKEVLAGIRPRHVLLTVALLVALAAFLLALAAFVNSLGVKTLTAPEASLAEEKEEQTSDTPTPAYNATEPAGVISSNITEPTTASSTRAPTEPSSTSSTTTTTTTTPVAQCGAGWKRFKDSCYKVTSSKSFAGVESECERHFEGSLASVHDEEENAFVAKHVRVEHGAEEEFYIGLTHNRTAHWTWLDGSVLNFTAWGSSEPNDTDVHCVQVQSAIGPNNGRWEAIDCISQRPAVCKRHVETFIGNGRQPSSRPSSSTGCPKNYYCGSGTITSPNYPFHYGHNENKTYHLRALWPDGILVLTFAPIGLDYHGDYVKVYDGPSASGSPMRTFEETSSAQVLRSSGQEMTVTFTSDSFSTSSGFAANFRTEMKH